MKILILICFLCLILCIQPVENHFFSWIRDKIQDKISANKSRHAFDCGKSAIQQILPTKMDKPRVTGGISAADHSFPWVVNVINLKSLKSCGGTIISSDTIITAAHCMVDPPKYVTVIAGAANLLGRLNLFNHYSVSKVIIHPNYVSCCDYDVALIKLKKKLQRSDMINSICLPNEKDQEIIPDTTAIIAGWGGKYPTSGLNAFGSFHLKQGLVYVKSNNYCQNFLESFDKKDEICATNTHDNGDFGDVSDRLKIRDRLQCKPFKWFLDNVYPEQFIPGESLYFGEIRNRGKSSICMDSQEIEDGDKPIIGYPCHGQAGNQFFLMSKLFEIRREEKCLDYPGGQSELGKPGKVVSFSCHSMQGNQMWTYENDILRHASGFCIELSSKNDKDIFMSNCDPTNNYQKWFWKKRINNSTQT
ncbi:unnamed protein product [Rotaria sp. Silwood1]|nr:unnamed protein product [Rotaria sp. Silwood1]